MKERPEIIPHLFRTEYSKIVSVLYRRFGFDQIELAEDIASETFLLAAQTWSYQGVPPNPAAWLYQVAKNKAKNQLQRAGLFKDTLAPEIVRQQASTEETELDLSPASINDSQLQMMFAICHPSIPPESQIGLSLRILCGFGIDEIADAFLTSKETINKRLYRAKEKLRESGARIEFPSEAEINQRLPAVLTTIYLLFNEGYYSESTTTIRKEFCVEAMRLCSLLVENAATGKPPVYALLSLMCFHSSRLDARFDEVGEMILYHEQDTSRWNSDLITKGIYFLNRSATGSEVTTYHLQATIAYWHTQKADTSEKWENILQLYNKLLIREYSPVAALNRTYALYKANGRTEAIAEAEKLNLNTNQFYFTLLGELYTGLDDNKALENFQTAYHLARTQTDKRTIEKKIERLRGAG